MELLTSWPVFLMVAYVLLTAIYVTFYWAFHPLSRYPGPFLASFTNLWKAYQMWTLHMPEKLIALHAKYGPVVRVGPNDLSFNGEGAIAAIYKGGRGMPKTAFYDGFTTFNPNLFGTQDDDIHAIRRRQMAHAFSLNSIKDMEVFIDKHLQRLRKTLDQYTMTGQVFDLKQMIAYYVLDVLGEFAFSRSFDSQLSPTPENLPPINDHIYLACLLGQMPEMMPYLKQVCAWTPLPWFQRLLRARAYLKNLTAECVAKRIHGKPLDRKDLLGSLIDAVDVETGSKLTELDLSTEAFAMVVAGSHTTSGTLTLLFTNLLQNPAVLAGVVKELDNKLSPLPKNQSAYAIDGLEQSLSWTMACVQENFRKDAVFTMPLPRRVTAEEGLEIDNEFVPKGTTVFIVNHVLHHNPSIWGLDHEKYDPTRFTGSSAPYFKRNLIPFSIGHRMCIGRNIAMTNILKVTTTLLKLYEFELVHPKEKLEVVSVGISEKAGPLFCRVLQRIQA